MKTINFRCQPESSMTIIEILEKFRVPYRKHGEDKNVRHGFIGLHCPFCGRPNDKFYLGYSLDRGYFTCWSCSYLKPANVISALTGQTLSACFELLGQLNRPEEIPERRTGRLVLPPKILTVEWHPAHRKYLRGRGFDPDELQRLWHLGAITIDQRLSWRIFIPIIWSGETVSWTTRTIGNREPRYISAGPEEEAIHHKDICYGGDYVRHAVIVHEGPADVWATGPGSVALFGLGFSATQVLWLSKIPQRFVCFDNEPAAQARAQQLCDQLGGFAGETSNIVLDAKDSASATPKERRKLRELLG